MRLKITAAVLGLLICGAAHAGGLGDLSKLPEERQKVLQDKYEKKLLGLPGPEAKANAYDVLYRLPKGYLSFFKALEMRQKELTNLGKEIYLAAVKENVALEEELVQERAALREDRQNEKLRAGIKKKMARLDELGKTISDYRRLDRLMNSYLLALAKMVVFGGDNTRRAEIVKRLPDSAVSRYIQLLESKESQSPDTTRNLFGVLGALGERAKAAIPLLEYYRDEEPTRGAAEALKKITRQ